MLSVSAILGINGVDNKHNVEEEKNKRVEKYEKK
jgi:hypothetical protein